MKERDVEHLARFLRISEARFIAEFTAESDDEGRTLKRTEREGCVFRSGNEGAVYEARPDSCQRFPHVVGPAPTSSYRPDRTGNRL